MQLFVDAATNVTVNALSVQLDETNVMQCAGERRGEGRPSACQASWWLQKLDQGREENGRG